jgi:hypothetical protein
MRPISFGRTGVAAFTTAALSLLMAPSPSYAAPPSVMTLSSPKGPSGGGNILTATTNAPAFRNVLYPTIQFQLYDASFSTSCRSTVSENAQISMSGGVVTVNPDSLRRLSPTKIAFTVPTAAYPATVGGVPSTVNTAGLALLEGHSSSKWNVCVYDTDYTGSLIATSTYTLVPRPRITDIFPASTPTYGGQTITVSGAAFGADTTATIDGAAVTNISVAANGTSFTGLAPAHPAGAGYPLIVRTAGILIRSSDPDNNGQPEDGDNSTLDAPILFTFDDSLGVTPSGATAGSVTYLDIRGQGFHNLTVDQNAAPTDPVAHVFLVQGGYVPASNRGVQECGEMVVIDDTELLCRLDLAADSLDPTTSASQVGVPVAAGDYTVAVVANGSTGAPNDTIVATGAFTVYP